MAASIPLGVVFPSVILFFSLTFVFYMVLLGIKNQVIAYTKLFRASLEYEDEIKLYIEELKKRV
jgi:predicted Zn-dependent protease